MVDLVERPQTDLTAEFKRAERVLSHADISGDPLGAAETWLVINTIRKAATLIETQAARIERQADIIKHQAEKLRRLRAEVRRRHSDFAFRQDPLNRKPGLYARLFDAKKTRALAAARALNGGE